MKMNVGPQAKCKRRLFAIVQMQIFPNDPEFRQLNDFMRKVTLWLPCLD